MNDKLNMKRVKGLSETAFNNVRELETAAFVFWAYAREHEMSNEELVRLMGVITSMIDPVVNSVGACKEAAAEGLSNG